MKGLSRYPRVTYARLNARQKENYNFQKISGLLADHGFATIRLTDDWKGADFIAQHQSGDTLKVQLKSRFCVYSKYVGQDIWVAFPADGGWYVFPHDEVLDATLRITGIEATESWSGRGGYSWGSVPTAMREVLAPYFLPSTAAAVG